MGSKWAHDEREVMTVTYGKQDEKRAWTKQIHPGRARAEYVEKGRPGESSM